VQQPAPERRGNGLVTRRHAEFAKQAGQLRVQIAFARAEPAGNLVASPAGREQLKRRAFDRRDVKHHRGSASAHMSNDDAPDRQVPAARHEKSLKSLTSAIPYC
jgi:hypothetical protein